MSPKSHVLYLIDEGSRLWQAAEITTLIYHDFAGICRLHKRIKFHVENKLKNYLICTISIYLFFGENVNNLLFESKLAVTAMLN